MKSSLEPLGVSDLLIVKKLGEIQSEDILKRMLLNKASCIVRAYCISAYNLASRDVGGQSDPYLILKMGNKTISDRKNYQMDEPNPKFSKHFDFETTFPGCPMLEISAMDHDMCFGDDLIGTTIIDLEDRYFLPEWNAIS